MKIYGIEKTTDMRQPQARIEKFRSESAARRWLSSSRSGARAFPGDDRNFHHRFRTAYVMPTGWRSPSLRELRRRANESSTPTYPRNLTDMLAEAVADAGERLEREAS